MYTSTARGRGGNQAMPRSAQLAVAATTVFFLAHLPAIAADWSQAQPMTVITKEYRFTPKHLKLRRDVPYRIHFENPGKEMHEFNAAKLFKNAEIGNPEVLNPDKTEVQLQPGEQKDLLLKPTKTGKYKLICPDHDFAGMVGDITVK